MFSIFLILFFSILKAQMKKNATKIVVKNVTEAEIPWESRKINVTITEPKQSFFADSGSF